MTKAQLLASTASSPEQKKRSHKARKAEQLPPSAPPDELVPDPIVCKEFHVTSMTLYRWTHDAVLGFPPPIKINKRNFRSRRQLEEFKARVLRQALATRNS